MRLVWAIRRAWRDICGICEASDVVAFRLSVVVSVPCAVFVSSSLVSSDVAGR